MKDQIFENSVGLILDIKLWSGSKNLKAEDFKDVELPPEDLISLGSKRIHAKEKFKPIQQVRTKTLTYLESVAVSLYSGKIWIIPEARKTEVESALKEFATEFIQEKAQFLSRFDKDQTEWLEQNKKWSRIIAPYLETPESVEKKFSFTWRSFKMSASEQVAQDLTGSVLHEISQISSDVYESIRGRERATPKNLNRIERLQGKLQGLAFVQPGVTTIELELSKIMDERDTGGALEGHGLFRLIRLLIQLKNPGILKDILEAARSGKDYQFKYDAPQKTTTLPPIPHNQPRLPEAWF
ncbi:DUF3150 domain-containing protein [Desulfonatronovibrio magnus]|uniref:DUF3150 domain-containing protein n=1 Tax=Desulfonatronovibrio magnus TaxID=698827 RepID=UPI0005EBE384|nr:DUF3150 domain-containing protein [Desulfonatronovibrio magnus]